MTAPDLELAAGLSAGELRTHVAADAHVQTTGRYVGVVRSETRIGMSEKMEAGGCYCNVVVEKRLTARNQVPGSQRRRRSAYGLRGASSTTSTGG
jgi:hypothetical protein